MFTQNKYKTWYYNIISRSQSRKYDGYTENHHIIPRSLGGSDDENNIVKLTAREHVICHILLTKFTNGQDRYKMISAVWAMANLQNQWHQRIRITSRQYEKIKKEISHLRAKAYVGDGNPFFSNKHTEETKQKMRKPKKEGHKNNVSVAQKKRFETQPGTFTNKKHTEESKQKMRKPKSEKQKTNQSLAMSGRFKGRTPHNKGKTFEELYGEERANEIRQKVRNFGEKNGFYGKTHSEEQIEKKRQEKLDSPKKICYHCSKEVDTMNYGRWHGDKCKFRK
jgi:hypothetical protein